MGKVRVHPTSSRALAFLTTTLAASLTIESLNGLLSKVKSSVGEFIDELRARSKQKTIVEQIISDNMYLKKCIFVKLY